jgi:hypothetical protein
MMERRAVDTNEDIGLKDEIALAIETTSPVRRRRAPTRAAWHGRSQIRAT